MWCRHCTSNCAAGASPMSDVTEFVQLPACGTEGVPCNSQATLQPASARVQNWCGYAKGVPSVHCLKHAAWVHAFSGTCSWLCCL